MNEKKVRTYLRDKAKNGSAMQKEVAKDLLDYEDEMGGHITDILNCGCISGTVSSMIYYTDTHPFFIRHYEEIFDLLDRIKEDTGEEFSNYGGDRANTLAWLGYEETVRTFADDLKIDV
jgi:hypothetical protein